MRMRSTLAAILAVCLAVTITVGVFAQSQTTPASEPEYVLFDLQVVESPTDSVTTLMDNSSFPVIISESYPNETGIISANVTINGVVYTYPEDFDYNYTGHIEYNAVTGFGLITIQETLVFKNLTGQPTIIGLAEEKVTGLITSPALDISNYENMGNYQVTGTNMFSDVSGNGVAMLGNSTGFMARHFALIKGWPL